MTTTKRASDSRGLYRGISDDNIDDLIEIHHRQLEKEQEEYEDLSTRIFNLSIAKDKVPIEEKRKLTAGLCVSYCCMGLAFGSLGALQTQLTHQIVPEITVGDFGFYVLMFRGIGWIAGSFIAGRLFELLKGNRLLWIAHISIALCCVAIPYIHNLWLLCCLYLLKGALMSCIEVGVNTLTVWVWKDKVAPYMQLIHFAFGLGLSLAPGLIGIIALIAWEHVKVISFWLIAGILLVGGIFPLYLKSPEIDADIAESAHVVHSNTRETSKSSNTHVISTFASVKSLQRIRYYVIVFLICAFLLFYGGSENTYGNWAVHYATEEYGMTEPEAEELDSVFWIAVTVGRLIAIPLTARVKTKTVLAFDLVGCLTTTFLLIELAKYKYRWVLWLATISLGMCMASIYGAAFAVPAELKVRLSGRAASAFIIAAGIGDVAAPSFIGVILKFIKGAVPWVVFLLLILCTIIYVFVYSFGVSTVEKKLDDEDLEELSRLDENWEFEDRLVMLEDDEDKKDNIKNFQIGEESDLKDSHDIALDNSNSLLLKH